MISTTDRDWKTACAKASRVVLAYQRFYLSTLSITPEELMRALEIAIPIATYIYKVDESCEDGTVEPRSAQHQIISTIQEYGPLDNYINTISHDIYSYYLAERCVLREDQASLNRVDAVTTTENRSFDFKLIDYLVLRTLNLERSSHQDRWYREFEFVMEVEDDASTLAHDSKKGSFNSILVADRNKEQAKLRRRYSNAVNIVFRHPPKAVFTEVTDDYRSFVSEWRPVYGLARLY